MKNNSLYIKMARKDRPMKRICCKSKERAKEITSGVSKDILLSANWYDDEGQMHVIFEKVIQEPKN